MRRAAAAKQQARPPRRENRFGFPAWHSRVKHAYDNMVLSPELTLSEVRTAVVVGVNADFSCGLSHYAAYDADSQLL